MNKAIQLLVMLVSFQTIYAQSVPNQWVWVNGDSAESPGIYGTLGRSDPANKPPGRTQASTWTDASGNLWLYGGFGKIGTHTDRLNDLWKYAPLLNEWTWIGGDSTWNPSLQPGRYGRKAIAAAFNKPGARYNATNWTDASGNFWMFGGYGYGSSYQDYLNDLWKYDPSSGLWTWMAGDTVSGSPLRPNFTGNDPTGRENAVSFVDRAGNLWLYGGNGYDGGSAVLGLLADLWKFSPATGQWTWVNGTKSRNTSGTYGTKGVPSSANRPGGKQSSAGWTDTSGNLWLFGGQTFDLFRNSSLNDLWKYSIASNLWTWIGGANTEIGNPPELRAVYGTRGVPDTANRPGGSANGKTFADSAGNLWLAGGVSLNLFWRYTPGSNQWTWMYGETTIKEVNYGSKGGSSPSNNPGRIENRNFWIDASGTIWLFGYLKISNGFGFYINDLWKFPLSAATLPVRFNNFTARKQQQSVLLDWTTAQEQNSHYFTVQRSGGNETYDSIGTVIAQGISFTSTDYSFTDKNPLSGTNLYRLKQVDLDGKFMYSAVAKVAMNAETGRFSIIQNPVHDVLQLGMQSPTAQKITLHIRDMSGHLLVSEERMGTQGSSIQSIAINTLSKGAYLIQVTSQSINGTKTFIRR